MSASSHASPKAPAGRDDLANTLWVCLLLGLVTIGVYWPIHAHEFVNIDDAAYVFDNPEVRAGVTAHGLRWAFGNAWLGHWHPLTWFSHMLDCQFFGLKPGAHHLVSLAFHVANALLAFLVFKRLTGAFWRPAFVAALFALHPMHVETVAWVADRKDLASTLCWFLALWGYVRYVERPSAGRYGMVLFAFAAGLMAKAMLITLPCVLLLLDFWPLGRLQIWTSNHCTTAGRYHPAFPGALKLVWEKIPFFVLGLLMTLVAFWAQKSAGAVASLEAMPLAARLSNAMVSYVRYIGKMLWPLDLAYFYPMPDHWPVWQVVLCVALITGTTALVIWRAKASPWLAVGWFWYTITLLPVIGLLQAGGQAMADRYSYLTLTGLFVMLGWGAPEVLPSWRCARPMLAAMGVATIAACVPLSMRQVSYWRNSQVLAEHALAVTTNNYDAFFGLGSAMADQGRTEEALRLLEAALRINPGAAKVHGRMGVILLQNGDPHGALWHYRRAVEIQPAFAEALNNQAWLLATSRDDSLRDGAAAVRLAERACDLTRCRRAVFVGTLAAAYAEAGRFDQAAKTGERASQIAFASGDGPLAETNLRLVELYRQRKPCRE